MLIKRVNTYFYCQNKVVQFKKWPQRASEKKESHRDISLSPCTSVYTLWFSVV